MFGGRAAGEDKMDRFKEVMGWVNDFIKTSGFVAGTDCMTLADLAFLATYSTIEATGNFDLTPYAETNAWFEKMKAAVPKALDFIRSDSLLLTSPFSSD